MVSNFFSDIDWGKVFLVGGLASLAEHIVGLNLYPFIDVSFMFVCGTTVGTLLEHFSETV